MDTFRARVQYGDFKGTVAADIADNVSLSDYLVSVGLAQSNEHVVAFRITSSSLRGEPVTDVSLVAYLSEATEFEPAPKSLRAVEASVTPGHALSFFKRFDLVAAGKSFDLSDTRADGPHYG